MMTDAFNDGTMEENTSGMLVRANGSSAYGSMGACPDACARVVDRRTERRTFDWRVMDIFALGLSALVFMRACVCIEWTRWQCGCGH